jgi:hypothetical protein
VSKEGIETKVEGEPIVFTFSQPPKHKYINVMQEKIKRKEN